MRLQQYEILEQSVPTAWYAQDIDRVRQKQKVNSHYLTNATLTEHVGRIYLDGVNSFSDPWRVPGAAARVPAAADLHAGIRGVP